jgi:TPR repeat protein
LLAAALMLAMPQAGAGPLPEGPERSYLMAVGLEEEGKIKDAIRTYRHAAYEGSGAAALRLGEIYDRGIPGVPRDYPESLRWYQRAHELGQRVKGGWGCPPKC